MMTELDDAQKKILKDRQRLWARQSEKVLNGVLKDLETIKYTVMDNDQLGGEFNLITRYKLKQAVDLLNQLYFEIPISFYPKYYREKNRGKKC